MTVSLEMVVPGLLGIWIDRKLGTEPLFVLIGFALGMISGIWHLITMTTRDRQPPLPNERPPRTRD